MIMKRNLQAAKKTVVTRPSDIPVRSDDWLLTLQMKATIGHYDRRSTLQWILHTMVIL